MLGRHAVPTARKHMSVVARAYFGLRALAQVEVHNEVVGMFVCLFVRVSVRLSVCLLVVASHDKYIYFFSDAPDGVRPSVILLLFHGLCRT